MNPGSGGAVAAPAGANNQRGGGLRLLPPELYADVRFEGLGPGVWGGGWLCLFPKRLCLAHVAGAAAVRLDQFVAGARRICAGIEVEHDHIGHGAEAVFGDALKFGALDLAGLGAGDGTAVLDDDAEDRGLEDM